ncbi:hypothetical protein EB72_00230 [Mycobacterium sp. SWH-M1]|nr:hypothetical protein EB72_00230 [Mycobacterium sp. SWH-M1]
MVSHRAGRTDSRLAARCAGVASVGAAVIHVAMSPAHWNDWMPSGVFFAAIGAFQLLWGFLAWWRASTLLLLAGVAANLGSAALWVMSRTAGAPFGPNAGETEAVEAAGISVMLLQCYVVMGAGWALYRRRRAEEVSAFGRSLVLMGATTIMAAAVTVGLASGLQGHHHHHGVEVEAESGHGPTGDDHGHGDRGQPASPAQSGATPYGHHSGSSVEQGVAAVPQTAPASSPTPDAGGHQHDHHD